MSSIQRCQGCIQYRSPYIANQLTWQIRSMPLMCMMPRLSIGRCSLAAPLLCTVHSVARLLWCVFNFHPCESIWPEDLCAPQRPLARRVSTSCHSRVSLHHSLMGCSCARPLLGACLAAPLLCTVHSVRTSSLSYKLRLLGIQADEAGRVDVYLFLYLSLSLSLFLHMADSPDQRQLKTQKCTHFVCELTNTYPINRKT